MTIKNALAALAFEGQPSALPAEGRDFDMDFTVDVTPTYRFDAAFALAPTGTIFEADFSADAYTMAAGPHPYGRFRIDYAGPTYGRHQIGTTLAVLRGGFFADFALYADPQEPRGYEGVRLSADFSAGRYVAETYPPPVGVSLDFAGDGLRFNLAPAADVYQQDTGGTVTGRYSRNTTETVLSGRPLRAPLPFYYEQALPGTSADDRLGHFILGRSILGGRPYAA